MKYLVLFLLFFSLPAAGQELAQPILVVRPSPDAKEIFTIGTIRFAK